MTNFFNEQVSNSYDERNSGLKPIINNVHFLIKLLLKDLPENSRILCVGVGTGTEIISLAKENPDWKFVGVDPSESMIEVCKQKLAEAGILNRCELITGYIEDAPKEEFDAVLSILVGHFIKEENRLPYYKNIFERLKLGGQFINTEISFDLDSDNFPTMLGNWKKVQTLMGATPESLEKLPSLMRSNLTILPPEKTEELMRSQGFSSPTRFFQSLMIIGWYAAK